MISKHLSRIKGTKLRYKTRPAKWLRELWLDGDERDWMPS